jgi:hypothetical protein
MIGTSTNVLRIPVTARPQTFTIALSGSEYTIRLYWLNPAQCWVFDFMDQSAAPILAGVPLVTGVDLLEQHRYLGFNGGLFVISDSLPPDTIPDFTHLGVTGHVYYLPR